jgi:hypothetical protein
MEEICTDMVLLVSGQLESLASRSDDAWECKCGREKECIRCVVKGCSTGNNSWWIWARWGTKYHFHLMCWLSSWTVWLLKMALHSSKKCQEPLAQHVTSLKMFMHLDMLLTWSYLNCWESLLILCTVLWLPFMKCIGLHITVEIVRTPLGLSSMQPVILAHHQTRLHCFHLSTNKMHLQYVIQ